MNPQYGNGGYVDNGSKTRKRVVFVLCIVILTLIGIAAYYLLIGTKSPENTAKKFITSIANSKPENAYKLLEAPNNSLEEFTKNFANPVSNNYKLEECTYVASKGSNKLILVKCPATKKARAAVINIEMSNEDVRKISKYVLR